MTQPPTQPLALPVLEATPETETATPLLLAHGLFGQGRNFSTIAKRLASDRRVLAVDMRNHGAAPHAPEMSYPAMAADLARTVETRAAGRAVVLGHSMGGKAAMALALSRPELVAGLIVADIAPMAYGHSHSGHIAAMKSVDLGAVSRRADAGAMLADAIPEAALRAFLLQSLEISEGTARWKLNLDALEAGMADMIGFPERFPRASYDGPTLVLHGGASDYVPASARPAIRTLFPAATIEAIPDAGHWLHAEQPEAFIAAVSRWLASTAA